MIEAKDEATRSVIQLITDIKTGKVTSSYEVTVRTVALLKQIVAYGDWITAQDLIKLIVSRGTRLINALPQHACAANMVRHVLKIIREEYVAAYKNKSEGLQSLHQIVTAGDDSSNDDYQKLLPGLRSAVLDHLSEFQAELETSADNIANQAAEHIHSNEIILTIGRSNVVEKFLKSAAKSRKFQVIVAESAPFYHGHALANSLGKSKIQTTVISDSAIFAMMSRVNKVIMGTHTVMANGGLRAVCGAHTVALAAKHYSVPVIVLVPIYKLSPVHLCSYEQDAFNVYLSPENVLPYSSGKLSSQVKVYNPMFDYVPPELVTLFISSQGGNAPSYIYRLLSELYHPNDYHL